MSTITTTYLKRFFSLSAVFLLILAALFPLQDSAAPDDGHIATEDLRLFSEGWYRVEDGEKIPVSVPGRVVLSDGEDLVLYNDKLSSQQPFRTLTTRSAVYQLQISLGEHVLYAYEDSAFPRNKPMRAKLDCDALVSFNPDSQPLVFTYQNDGSGIFDLAPVYMGSSSAVLVQHCKNDAVTIVLVFTMALLAAGAVGISFYLRKAGLQDSRFINIAGFLLLCGLWCTLDSSIVQYLSQLSPLVCRLSFFAFMTLAIPMLHFVRNTGAMKHWRSLDLCIGAFHLNALVQGLAHIIWGVALIDMLVITHVLLACGVILVSLLMLKEYHTTKSPDLLITLQAFAILGGSGLLALGLYWLLGISYYSIIFEFGILLFILRLLVFLINSMATSLRLKAEIQIYKRLSREDRLTGLENRRAFEEVFLTLETEAEHYRNVALIFLDLDRLKYTNDHYGHNAGDELIIAAARCLEQTFAPQGRCYRIGGDEFAVILTDPTESAADWNARLDEKILQYNQDNPYSLSISRGVSYLRAEDGSIKRTSDWKFEADRAMYAYKNAHNLPSSEQPLFDWIERQGENV